jgi:hypothetical protein
VVIAMARSFNGTFDYIECLPGTGLGFSATAFAMACWIKFSAAPGGAVTFLGKGYDGNTAYFFQMNSTNVFVGSYNGTVQGLNAGYPYFNGTWHHLYGDWDGTQWHLYLNGGSLVTPGGSVGPVSTTSNFVIGAAHTGGTSYGQYTAASFAECAVWNGALNTTDIIALSNGRRANTVTSSGKTLLGYWPLLSADASSAPDYSGKGNPGTLHGTALDTDPAALDAWPVAGKASRLLMGVGG